MDGFGFGFGLSSKNRNEYNCAMLLVAKSGLIDFQLNIKTHAATAKATMKIISH